MIFVEETTVIAAPIERCFDLARSIEIHALDNVHWGTRAMAMPGGMTSGLAGMGDRAVWRARHFGVLQRLTTEVTAMNAPTYFQDTMIQGIFHSMRHDHFFRESGDSSTEMRDVFCFAVPLPVLGRIAEILVLRQYMTGLLQERCRVIKWVAESDEWRRYLL